MQGAVPTPNPPRSRFQCNKLVGRNLANHEITTAPEVSLHTSFCNCSGVRVHTYFAIITSEYLAGLAPFGWLAHSRHDIAVPMVLGVGVLRARSFLRRPWPDPSDLYLLELLHLLSATASLLFFSCVFLCIFLSDHLRSVFLLVGGFCLSFVSRSVVNLFVRARWLSHGRFCGGVCPVP